MLQASDEPNQRQYNTVRDQDGNGRKLLQTYIETLPGDCVENSTFSRLRVSCTRNGM